MFEFKLKLDKMKVFEGKAKNSKELKKMFEGLEEKFR
jgi:hypothetical protein